MNVREKRPSGSTGDGMHVALLRAVNLAGHNKVSMSDLRELAAGLGLEKARTLLQSGNLVFSTGKRTPDALEALLEKELHKRLGLKTEFMVRTAAEWEDVVARNPFPKEAAGDPSHLVVVFLKDRASQSAIDAAMAGYKGPEIVRASGRHAYIVYPEGIGRSKLSTVLTEARMGSRGTGRNWNTVLKLLEAVRG